jgi:hypothetical protein
LTDVGPALTRQKKTSPAPMTLRPGGKRALESFEDDPQNYNSGIIQKILFLIMRKQTNSNKILI